MGRSLKLEERRIVEVMWVDAASQADGWTSMDELFKKHGHPVYTAGFLMGVWPEPETGCWCIHVLGSVGGKGDEQEGDNMISIPLGWVKYIRLQVPGNELVFSENTLKIKKLGEPKDAPPG